jgi:hypothetical protein
MRCKFFGANVPFRFDPLSIFQAEAGVTLIIESRSWWKLRKSYPCAQPASADHRAVFVIGVTRALYRFD